MDYAVLSTPRAFAVAMTPMKSPLHWSSCAASHVGHVRSINEDAYLDRPDIGLWAVADGMGGHHAGDIASTSIVQALNEIKPDARLSQFINQTEDRLLGINQRLRQMADEHQDNRTIGSTVIAMLACEQHCALLWAGDSRAYQLREGRLIQLTRDHSQVEELVQRGLLMPEQAEFHPAANIITRAVGAAGELYIDVDLIEAKAGDTYLLCSDGLYKHVNNADLSEILTRENIRDIAEELINLTLERGASDNVTVIVIRYTEADN